MARDRCVVGRVQHLARALDPHGRGYLHGAELDLLRHVDRHATVELGLDLVGLHRRGHVGHRELRRCSEGWKLWRRRGLRHNLRCRTPGGRQRHTRNIWPFPRLLRHPHCATRTECGTGGAGRHGAGKNRRHRGRRGDPVPKIGDDRPKGVDLRVGVAPHRRMRSGLDGCDLRLSLGLLTLQFGKGLVVLRLPILARCDRSGAYDTSTEGISDEITAIGHRSVSNHPRHRAERGTDAPADRSRAGHPGCSPDRRDALHRDQGRGRAANSGREL
jgi:hypothetical protein